MMSPFRRLSFSTPNRAPRTRLQTTVLEDRTVPATFTVTDLGDAGAGTLRDAVTQANANPDADTIVFGTTGTITLASEIDITESVTIDGAGAVTLDGGGATRMFEINNAARLLNVTLSGLTFQNGDATGSEGGAIRITDDEVVTIRSSNFTGNTADSGGALYSDGGIIQIVSTTFSANTASDDDGGAISIDGPVTLSIQNSIFTGNSSTNEDGGAIYIDGANGVIIQGATFAGNTAGEDGGAIAMERTSGSVLIENTSLTGNIAVNQGGALYLAALYSGSTFSIVNSTISQNSANVGGGARFSDVAGTLSVNGSNFTDNTAVDGAGFFVDNSGFATLIEVANSQITGNAATSDAGGIYFYMFAGSVTITNSVISGNTADGDGGGISVFYYDGGSNNAVNVSIIGSTISGNTAGQDGGGIWIGFYENATGDFIVRDTTISGNTAGSLGGGVFFYVDLAFNGSILIDGSSITGNAASEGGGIDLTGGDFDSAVVISNSTISGNTSDGDGGGMDLYGRFYGGLEIVNTTISDNTAGDEGGGFWFGDSESDSTVTVKNSTISGNSAVNDGGGIYLFMDDGTLILANSTVSGNSTTAGDGGGIFTNSCYEDIRIQNSTIVFNSASAGQGGGLFMIGQETQILSSIISGNTAADGNDLAGDGYAFTSQFSLIGDATIGGTSTLVNLGFNLFGVDPLLGALQDNGGPTFTHALLRGSPAIDFGFNFAGTLYDQRGQPFLRTFGDATDIGAFEFQLPPPEPIVVGAGAGGSGEFVVYNLDGTERARITAFDPSVTGGVRVATADVTGDGVYDYIVGAGPGAPSLVKIYDGSTLNQIAILIAFEATFTGGVYVAGGDIDGDGFAEVVVTPDQGGGPVVAVYDGEALAGGSVVQLARFFGIQDANFRGGARVAVGDVTGDGLADIVVAAGFEGGPRVTVWEATAVLTGNTGADATPYANFFAFEDTLRNGTFVAVGDLDGDGFGDVIVGAGPGGGPRVVVFDGADLATGTLTETASFFAGDDTLRNGVPVAVADLNGDYEIDIVAGVGEPAAGTVGVPSTVRVYSASSLQDDPLNPIATLDPFPGFTGGVFVG